MDNKYIDLEDVTVITNPHELKVTFKKRGHTRDIIRRFLKNKVAVVGFIIIVLLMFCALFPQVLATHPYDEQELSRQYLTPCKEFIFGTDEMGRDIYSRVIYGARVSLAIGLVAVAIGCISGTLVGCIAGYYGSFIDNVLMRLVDILLAVPPLMLAMSVVAALGIDQTNLAIALGLGCTGAFARIVRAQILTIKEQEYIEVAHAIGANDARIILKHLLPNSLAPIIVQICLNLGACILSAAGMSFIGLGIAPPTPEWGSMLSTGRAVMRDHWHVVFFPGVAIMLTVFAFNMFGDGLRDALDPRLKS